MSSGDSPRYLVHSLLIQLGLPKGASGNHFFEGEADSPCYLVHSLLVQLGPAKAKRAPLPPWAREARPLPLGSLGPVSAARAGARVKQGTNEQSCHETPGEFNGFSGDSRRALTINPFSADLNLMDSGARCDKRWLWVMPFKLLGMQ